MNFQMIRQTSAIILSKRQCFTNQTCREVVKKLQLNKFFHTNVPAMSPRFTRNIKDEEIIAKPIEMDDSPEPFVQERTDKLKFEKNRSEVDPISSWDEVENEMFRVKKPMQVEIPKIKFKGGKAMIGNPNKIHFDMEEIDRQSERTMPQVKKTKKKANPPVELTDPEIGKYLNLDRDDPMLNKILLTVYSRKQRESQMKLVLEGRRLIEEALLCGLKLDTLIFSRIEQARLLKNILKNKKVNLIKVANHNLKLWSQLTTAPGIMGIFEKPENFNEIVEKRQGKRIPVTIICDNIREPSNLGAVVRVAAACGVEQVILTKGCTNPWEPKCIRSSSGAHFRVKIIDSIPWDYITNHLPPKFDYYIADNQSHENLPTVTYDSLNFQAQPESAEPHKVLVIGGESHGISEEAKQLLLQNLQHKPDSGACLKIDLAKGVDSLNVASALAVILFEIRRKLKEVAVAP